MWYNLWNNFAVIISSWQWKAEIAAEVLWESCRSVTLNQKSAWPATNKIHLLPFSHCGSHSMTSLCCYTSLLFLSCILFFFCCLCSQCIDLAIKEITAEYWMALRTLKWKVFFMQGSYTVICTPTGLDSPNPAIIVSALTAWCSWQCWWQWVMIRAEGQEINLTDVFFTGFVLFHDLQISTIQ